MTKEALPPVWDETAGRGEEATAHSPAVVDTLKQAMRRARADNAERAGVTSDLRAARLGRLELLHEALKPLIAQIPPDVDAFDIGLLPSGNPRLFIDMIGFVEMGRDSRLYRFLQDTRTGRVVLRESEDVAATVEAVTDYIARRLLEREKALAADTPAGNLPAMPPVRPPSERASGGRPGPAPAMRRRPPRLARLLAIAFSFLIDLLGSVTLFTALAVAAWYAWTRLHGGS